MLFSAEDSSIQSTVQEMRIGPGEGGKLTPLAPGQRSQVIAGERTRGLRAAKPDSSKKNGKLKPEKSGDSLKAHQSAEYR